QVTPIWCETMKHTNEYAEYLKKQADCKRIEEELIRVESVWCDTMFTTLLQKTDTYIFKNLDKNVKESVSYLRDRLYFVGCRSSKLAEADLKTINALLYHCRSFLYKTNDHPTDKMLEALDQLSVRIATVEISKPNTSGGDASTGSTYFGSEYFSYLSSILSVSSWLPFSAPQPKVVHPLPSCWPYYVSILVQLSEVKALWIIPKKEECFDKAIKAEARIDELLQKQQIEGKEWKIFEPHSFKPDKEHEPEVTVERVNANINPYDYDTIDVALTVIPEGMTLIREWKISQSVKISKLSTQFSRNYPKTADQLEGLATKATALSQRRHALKLDFSRESDLTNEDVIQWESDAKVLLDEYDDYLKKNPYQISIIRDMTFKIQSEGKKIFLGNHATLQRIRLFYTDIVRLHANNKKHEIIGLIKQAMEKKDASKTIKVITHRMDYLLDNWIKQQLFSVCHLNIYCNKNNLVENSCRDPIKICLNGIIFFVNLYETVRLLKPTDVTKDSSTMACWHQFESHVKAYLDSGKITEYFDLLRQQLDNDSIWSKSDDYRQAVTLLTPYFCKESVNTVCFDDYLTINFNPQEKPLTDLCVNITMSMAMHSFQYHLDCLKSKKMTVMEWEHSKKNLLAITKFTFDGPLSCYWFHLLYFGSIIKNRTDELVSLIKNNCILSATVSCPEGETTVDQGGDSLPANKASKKAEPSDKLSIYTQLTEVERQKLVESLLEEEGIVSKPQIAHQVKKQSFTAPTAVWRTETENTSDKQQESTDVTKIENQEDLLFSEAEKAICSDPGLAIELLEKINSKATAENNEAVIYRSVLGLAEAAAQLLLPQIAYIPKATKVLKQIEAEMQKALKEQTFEIKYSNYKKLLDYIDLALTRHSDISTGINRYQRYLDSAKYTTQALESETLSTGAVGAIKEKCATCKQYIKQYADYITTLLKCIECRNKALPYLMRNQEQLSDDDPKRRAARKQNAILVKKATQTFTHVLNELKKYK
ncbi:MAG: hypothetical protein OXC48_02135, partial [Endozoicomonadaceae bacterium]|nr:hypothetical protein [Endozoicomonadaceae bacterium]